jgi:hypothetical protein
MQPIFFDCYKGKISKTISVETEIISEKYFYTARLDKKEVGKAHVVFHYTYSELKSLNNCCPSIQGIGTALVQVCIKEALSRNVKALQLYSLPGALVFYWKLGFRFSPGFNFRTRITVLHAYALKKLMKEGIDERHPTILTDERYILIRDKLAKRLSMSPDEIDVFAEAEKRPPCLVSQKLEKKMLKSGARRPDTENLGVRHMVLCAEAVKIWEEIIQKPETLSENLQKLRTLPQPSES